MDHEQKLYYSVLRNDGMTHNERVVYFLLLMVGGSLTLVFGIWWFAWGHVSNNFQGIFHLFDYVLFFLLTYIVWHQIAMEVFAWYIAAYVKIPIPTPPQEGLHVAYLTAFVPGSEPYSILENTLKAMVGVKYPHDTWLLDEGNDDEAKRICARYGVHHYSRKGNAEFNAIGGKFAKKTKGGNYNSWLHHYGQKYDIVAQHDVDFIPQKNFLLRTLGYFNDPTVAFVGTPQVYGNADESWIARGAAEQTYGFYGPLQKGFYGHDMTLLIGANHIVRTEAYRDIDGYTAHIAEDMLTGMKLYTHKNDWKSVYVPESLLVGEGPSTWQSYFAQQLRWSYGCMDIVFRHAPRLLPMMSVRRIINYIVLQQFYFSGIAQVVGILLLAIYFLFGITSASMELMPILYLYLPLLIYQIIFQIWLQRLNIDPTHERGLLLRGKLLALAAWPIYFLAFVGVVRGKPLTYVVTPKGDQQTTDYMPQLFVIHFILGAITLISMAIGYTQHHMGGPMVFFATLNTVLMFYFAGSETVLFLLANLKQFVRHYRMQ